MMIDSLGKARVKQSEGTLWMTNLKNKANS